MVVPVLPAASVTFTVNGLPSVTVAMKLPDPTEGGRNNVYGRFMDEFGRGNRDDRLQGSSVGGR